MEFPVSSATMELAQYSGLSDWVDVCKAWQDNER